MNKGTVVYLGVFSLAIILFAFFLNQGQKNYYVIEGKIQPGVVKKGDIFSVTVKTGEGEKITLSFHPTQGGSFTSRLELFLEPGDLIKVQVMESEGRERTVHAILSVK